MKPSESSPEVIARIVVGQSACNDCVMFVPKCAAQEPLVSRNARRRAALDDQPEVVHQPLKFLGHKPARNLPLRPFGPPRHEESDTDLGGGGQEPADYDPYKRVGAAAHRANRKSAWISAAVPIPHALGVQPPRPGLPPRTAVADPRALPPR